MSYLPGDVKKLGGGCYKIEHKRPRKSGPRCRMCGAYISKSGRQRMVYDLLCATCVEAEKRKDSGPDEA